jgi:hypothetical protein
MPPSPTVNFLPAGARAECQGPPPAFEQIREFVVSIGWQRS